MKTIQFGNGVFMREYLNSFINTSFANPETIIVNTNKKGENIKKSDFIYQVSRNSNYDNFSNQIISRENFLSIAREGDIEIVFSDNDNHNHFFAVDNFENPETYSMLLLKFLYVRYAAGVKEDIYIVPCEKIEHNGSILRNTILKYIEEFELGQKCRNYFETKVHFYNTLHDEFWNTNINFDDKDKSIGVDDLTSFWLEKVSSQTRDLKFNNKNLNIKFVDGIENYYELKKHIFDLSLLCYATSYMDNNISFDEFKDYCDAMLQYEVIPYMNVSKSEIDEYKKIMYARMKNLNIDEFIKGNAFFMFKKYNEYVIPVLNWSFESNCNPSKLMNCLYSLLRIYTSHDANVHDDENLIKYAKSHSELELLKYLFDNRYLVSEYQDKILSMVMNYN